MGFRQALECIVQCSVWNCILILDLPDSSLGMSVLLYTGQVSVCFQEMIQVAFEHAFMMQSMVCVSGAVLDHGWKEGRQVWPFLLCLRNWWPHYCFKRLLDRLNFSVSSREHVCGKLWKQ